MKKAFIFDLDGVIVDTAKYHYLAWQKLAQQLGIEFTPEHNEELKGVSRVRSLEIILNLGGIQASQEDKNKWLIQKNEDYLSYLVNMDESEILPGSDIGFYRAVVYDFVFYILHTDLFQYMQGSGIFYMCPAGDYIQVKMV